jgi:hypothetical protein
MKLRGVACHADARPILHVSQQSAERPLLRGEAAGEENGGRYSEEQHVVLPLERRPPGITEEIRCLLIESHSRGLFVPP